MLNKKYYCIVWQSKSEIEFFPRIMQTMLIAMMVMFGIRSCMRDFLYWLNFSLVHVQLASKKHKLNIIRRNVHNIQPRTTISIVLESRNLIKRYKEIEEDIVVSSLWNIDNSDHSSFYSASQLNYQRNYKPF